jgi:hypothetical protein
MFLSQLKVNIAESIPINIDRLEDIEYHYELSNILLKLYVKSIKNNDKLDELDVNQIIKCLNILIQQKDITIISRFNTTNYLDSEFGFKKYIYIYIY